MKIETKIQGLIDYIDIELPDGCQDLNCVDCPLHRSQRGVRGNLCAALRAQKNKRESSKGAE